MLVYLIELDGGAADEESVDPRRLSAGPNLIRRLDKFLASPARYIPRLS
jgi:hypothetical protein